MKYSSVSADVVVESPETEIYSFDAVCSVCSAGGEASFKAAVFVAMRAALLEIVIMTAS